MTRQTTTPLEHTNLGATYRLLDGMVRLHRDGELDLRPPYQRGSVWTDDQRVALVRSWLLGIPTGVIILSDRENQHWRKANGTTPLREGKPSWACVDGQQRITTAASWFDSEFAVPASWFEPEYVEKTEDTADGPYVRYSGLTIAGQRMVDVLATVQVAEAKTCASIADEASIYLLVNGGGTPQTDADMANAARHTNH